MAVKLLVLFMSCLVSKSFCDNVCDGNQLVTDFGPEDCPNGTYYIIEPNNCFPKCEEKVGYNDVCNSSASNCAPGLWCDNSTNTCQLNETSCLRFNFIPDLMEYNKPSCLPDGSYAAKQCKGELGTGRCFCYDPEGNRIFGQEWSNKADQMTCACSRRRAELEKQTGDVITLHCDSTGNYESLQCVDDQCWCADPQTGEVLYSVMPQKMMEYLPCYHKELVGDHYLRVCESKQMAELKIKQVYKTHGTEHITEDFLVCDWDGAYGPYTVLNQNQAHCTWRDGTVMAGQSNLKDVHQGPDCNCARDRKMFELAEMEFTLECMDNGSYKPVQQSAGQYYCVDSDGYATTQLQPDKDLQCPKY